MRGRQTENFQGAQFEIDFDFGEMRAEAVFGVGDTPAILVQGFGGRIISGFAAHHIAALIKSQRVKIGRRAQRLYLLA